MKTLNILLILLITLITISSCNYAPKSDKSIKTYYYKVKLIDVKAQSFAKVTMDGSVEEPYQLGDTILIKNDNYIWSEERDDISILLDLSYCVITKKLGVTED